MQKTIQTLTTLLLTISLLGLVSCITPQRIPPHGQMSITNIGDSIYTYKTIDSLTYKAYNQQELIYSGVSKGTLKIFYREFAGDFARPSFFQEASYDYSPGMTLNFKGAKIKVKKANSSIIEYTVLNGFTGEMQ